ncbi:MAG: DUF342 domain-containing protein [Promethearchaeota archaeon]
MDKGKDFFLDDLVNSTEKLIEDINIDELKTELPSQTQEKIQGEVLKKNLKSLNMESEPVFHGYVDIRITQDDMIAKADFYPPTQGGMLIEESLVREQLISKGIVHGIDWDAIRTKIEQCNNEIKPITDVVIARGDRPIDEVPQHLVVEDHLLNKSQEIEKEKQSIDYKQLISYTLVKKGEKLAHVAPIIAGKEGKTIKGELIPYKRSKITPIKNSLNTLIEDNRVVATCDGRFEYWNNMIYVKEVFEVIGNVDYKTGNISFPGDVIIHGRVCDGFKVEAGGTIFCKEALDASEVICGKDLVVNRGIIGRNKGRVKVGGRIITKYIENCYVEAKDNIYVESGILHSMIHTQNTLEMGVKSVIAGGKIFAQNGVKAYHIGTKMGIKTEISCGIDYLIQQKIEWIKDTTVALASKLLETEKTLKRKTSDFNKLVALRDKIKNAIHKLNEAARSLVYQLDKSESAEIIVKGSVYPGVYFEICHVAHIIPRELAYVRFWLNKEKGKIDVTTYKSEHSLHAIS